MTHRFSSFFIVLAAFVAVGFASPVVAPAQAQEDEWETVALYGETLAQNGFMLDADSIEFHFVPGVVDQDITVRILSEGQFNTVDTVAQLPKQFRSKQQVVEYQIIGEQDGTDIDVSGVVVRMPYYGKKDRRRRVFFAEEQGGKWSKLRSRVNVAQQYVQVSLPSHSGVLVVGGHKSKKEIPVKQDDFAKYGGTAYSDTAAVIDMKSGRFLYKQQAKKQRSIASVTKIMTGVVFAESDTDGNGVVTYEGDYDRIGATAGIEVGETLRKQDVLMATLVRSANNMAVTLSNSTSMSEDEFIQQMNNRAAQLKLRKTAFHEPTGLDSDNISTAGNLARLGRFAFTEHADLFQSAADYTSYTLTTQNTGRAVTLPSTNKFDGRGLYELVAFKTGYLPGSAERTLVAEVQKIGSEESVVLVLMGNPYYNTIFEEAFSLAHWTFSNWEFQNYAN